MLAFSRCLKSHHRYRMAQSAGTPQYDILAVLLLNVENFQKQQIKVNVSFEAGTRTRHQTAVSIHGFIQHCLSKLDVPESWEWLAEEADVKLTFSLYGSPFFITLHSIFTTKPMENVGMCASFVSALKIVLPDDMTELLCF